MAVLLKNNAVSRLAASLTTGATALSVTAGDGALYPSPGAGDWFPLTVVKSDGSLEIMRCTGRSGDVLTVTRAQEGTAALAFASGDRAELRVTAAALNTVLGGSSSAPVFGGIELIGATPNVDFHFGSSAADFTSRIITDVNNELAVSSSTKEQIRFTNTQTLVNGDLTTIGNGIFRGGLIRIGIPGTTQYTDYGVSGNISTYNSVGTLLSTGNIWHSGNFIASGKVTGDAITAAGFDSNNVALPYFRRLSDGGIYYLQTRLGYTPVQQGTGVSQLTNAVKLGWDGSAVRITVDSTDMGQIWADFNGAAGKAISGQGGANVGGVGTYGFFRCGVAATPGTLVAGGNLLYGWAGGQGGTSPSGTWRCMGDTPVNGVTLFLRAS